MAELTSGDLPAATRAKFSSDEAAEAAINAALVAARRYCGWHVSPVQLAVTLLLDGPCGRVLDLPTRRVTDLIAVKENGTTLDTTRLNWSENGSVRKRSGTGWSCDYRSIEVTMTHGYSEDEAADWRRAIIEMVDDMVPGATGEEGGTLVRKRVDDVEYQWSDADLNASASRAVYSVSHVLDSYRLTQVLFA